MDCISTSCALYQKCAAANEIRWKQQEEINAAERTRSDRWGRELDALRVDVADSKLKIAESNNSTRELRASMLEHKAAMESVASVLDGLDKSIRENNARSEEAHRTYDTNHRELLAAMTALSSTSYQAVNHADTAQKAAEKLSSRVGTMTSAVLFAWAVTIAALVLLAQHYGLPALYALFDYVMARARP